MVYVPNEKDLEYEDRGPLDLTRQVDDLKKAPSDKNGKDDKKN